MMKRIIVVIICIYNPVCYPMEAAMAQQLLEHNRDLEEIQEGTVRFRQMERRGLGCRRGCAFASPLIVFVIIVAYILVQRMLDKEVLVMIE